MKATEVNILLNSYNDIFSDFDPKGYGERILSDDFIVQAKKIAEDKSGTEMLLKFFMPADKRNAEVEKVIVTRLSFFFKNLYQQFKLKLRKSTNTGLQLTILGIILMIAASYLSFVKPDKYHFHLLLVLFEPAGWFMLWMGLEHLVYAPKETKKDLAFYSKMQKSEIVFCDYKPTVLKEVLDSTINKSV